MRNEKKEQGRRKREKEREGIRIYESCIKEENGIIESKSMMNVTRIKKQ